jgi:hypothetical protein
MRSYFIINDDAKRSRGPDLKGLTGDKTRDFSCHVHAASEEAGAHEAHAPAHQAHNAEGGLLLLLAALFHSAFDGGWVWYIYQADTAKYVLPISADFVMHIVWSS